MADHLAAAAGTCFQVEAGQCEEAVLPRRLRWTCCCRLVVDLKMAARLYELRVNVAAGMEAVVADLDEAVRQDVEQEATDELRGRHGHLPTVLRAEVDAVLVERNESLVRDTYAMRVPAEVLEDLLGSGERALGVHHPVLAVQRVLELVEALRARVYRTRTPQVELAAFVGMGKSVEDLASEQTR